MTSPRPAQHLYTQCLLAAQMEVIASKLIEALATHMGVGDPSSLAPLFAKHSSLLRLNYFPPCPDCHEHLGVSHHTDGCAITLLLQEVPGLQVR